MYWVTQVILILLDLWSYVEMCILFASELYAWDSEAAKCDVEEQLGAFAQQQPRGQEGPNGTSRHGVPSVNYAWCLMN